MGYPMRPMGPPRGSKGTPCGYFPQSSCLPPQQGDSNLGWVGGHQWGLSWRDRPPARRPPAGTRRLCVIFTQGHCVIAKSRISGEVFAEGSAP